MPDDTTDVHPARLTPTPPPPPDPDDGATRPFAVCFFHGTRAALAPGDRLVPGHAPNFGPRPHAAGWVYCTATLDAAVWGAELAAGEGPGRVYVVEPMGALEDDPELTDTRFVGNPSRSYRSRAPLRVVGEVMGWRAHAPEALTAMRAAVARQAPTALDGGDPAMATDG